MQKSFCLTVCAFLVLFTFVKTPVFALESNGDDNSNEFRAKEIRSKELNYRLVSPKPSYSPKPRLTDQKLRFCEAREENIKKRHVSLMGIGSGILGKLDAIVARAKEFYTQKVLTSGKSLDNYDELVADIDAKKQALAGALAQVPDGSGFDCSGDDPKGTLTDYREKMKLVKDALKNYRESVKNLISAIHRVMEGSK